jgi:hypothetical protein
VSLDAELPGPSNTVPASAPAPAIGKIERVPLRDVWRHEAHNLTTWLEENIDVLNDALGLALANVERERAAGAFSADLVGEDDSGGTVIIENQLERSNHDHLGKLITYTAFLDARTAIWIVSDPRPEHVRAVSWLNESSATSFYLVKIEGIRIGASPPAPLLTLIVGPSEASREVGEVKKERSERHSIRRHFWTELLEKAKQRTRLHAAVSPSDDYWIGAGAGRTGLSFNYAILQHGATAELYIDRGRDAEAENERIFDALLAHRTEIESTVNYPISWERLDGKRACRIAIRLTSGGYRDEGAWPQVQAEMIAAMTELEKALRPHLEQLRQ